MKTLVILAMILILQGCSSEVDKCVAAYMKSYSIDYPNDTKSEKAAYEARARHACLKAQSGRSD